LKWTTFLSPAGDACRYLKTKDMTPVCTIRHWIAVSLLALTVPIFTASVTCAEKLGDAGKRKAAIDAILQAGGDITMAVQLPTMNYLERIPISEVNLRKATVDNSLLIQVGNLKEVQRLDLSNANIDDDGLRQIAHLQLRELWLQDTKLTDASAVTLSGIKTLNFLATEFDEAFGCVFGATRIPA